MDDAPTGPLSIPVHGPPVYRDPQSVADRVVTALAPTPPAEPRLSALRLRLLLIGLLAGTVATSIVIAFHLGGSIHGVHDTALNTRGGDCLTWPEGATDHAAVVNCADDHLFEVTEPVDIDAFSGQPGLDVNRELDETFKEACPSAAGRYLGSRLDPGGRFVVGMLWSPFEPGPQSGGRLVCGLQLRSDGSASKPFRGHIAELDQSNVWPSGTCLGIANAQSTDIPVSCAEPHAMEVIGTANLAKAFGGDPPSVADQDAAVRNICNTKTAEYLSPVSLAETTLTLHYTPISDAGWVAGSHWTACRLASMQPDGSWAPLLGAARSGLLIDGVAPEPAAVAVRPPAVVATDTIVNAGATATPATAPPTLQSPVPQVPGESNAAGDALADNAAPPPVGPTTEPPLAEQPPLPVGASELPAAPPEPPPPPASDTQGPLPGPPPDRQGG